MYEIEKKEYGYKLTLSGSIEAGEMIAWFLESKQILASAPENFGVFVDMRNLIPLDDDAQVHMKEGQKLYRHMGMFRSVVIVENVITTMQFRRIAMETCIYDCERYIDATSVFNWEQVGLDWIVEGVEPDFLQQIIDKYSRAV